MKQIKDVFKNYSPNFFRTISNHIFKLPKAAYNNILNNIPSRIGNYKKIFAKFLNIQYKTIELSVKNVKVCGTLHTNKDQEQELVKLGHEMGLETVDPFEILNYLTKKSDTSLLIISANIPDQPAIQTGGFEIGLALAFGCLLVALVIAKKDKIQKTYDGITVYSTPYNKKDMSDQQKSLYIDYPSHETTGGTIENNPKEHKIYFIVDNLLEITE